MHDSAHECLHGRSRCTMKRFSQTLKTRSEAYGLVYQRDRQKGRGFRGLQLVGDAHRYLP